MNPIPTYQKNLRACVLLIHSIAKIAFYMITCTSCLVYCFKVLLIQNPVSLAVICIALSFFSMYPLSEAFSGVKTAFYFLTSSLVVFHLNPCDCVS